MINFKNIFFFYIALAFVLGPAINSIAFAESSDHEYETPEKCNKKILDAIGVLGAVNKDKLKLKSIDIIRSKIFEGMAITRLDAYKAEVKFTYENSSHEDIYGVRAILYSTWHKKSDCVVVEVLMNPENYLEGPLYSKYSREY